MNDDDLRELLRAAHVDDGTPPSFASTLAHEPRRRAPLFAICSSLAKQSAYFLC